MHGDMICSCPSPPPVGAPALRAPPSRRNIAVVSHAQYVLTVTAAHDSRVKAAGRKAAWWPWPLTLKVVSKSCVTWATSVLILVSLGLSVLDLGPMYATDRCQTSNRQDRQTSDAHHRLMPLPRGGGIKREEKTSTWLINCNIARHPGVGRGRQKCCSDGKYHCSTSGQATSDPTTSSRTSGSRWGGRRLDRKFVSTWFEFLPEG